jgi:hypothetical protein
MAFGAYALSVVDNVLLKGGLGDPWSATAAQVAEDQKTSEPHRPSSATNTRPAQSASEALLTRAPARPSSASFRKALSAEELAESSDPPTRALRRSQSTVSQQNKCVERLMVTQIHRLPPTHYDHQRYHMRAEELRHNVRPQSGPGTQTQPGQNVGLPGLRAAACNPPPARGNAACYPPGIVTPSASRSQPRPVAGRKHAVKHLEIELKNLKRVFALLDVGKDGVVTSEDIFVITG